MRSTTTSHRHAGSSAWQEKPRQTHKRWMDNVRKNVTTVGLLLVEASRLTQDREKWKSLVRLSMRAQASPFTKALSSSTKLY